MGVQMEQRQDGEMVDDAANIGIDSETIISSIGPNNKYLERIRYKFG